MKKVLTLVLCCVVLLSLLCVSAFAQGENKLKNGAWSKYYNKEDVTKLQENGEDYYSAGGITTAWGSPGIDIMPAVKAAMGTEDEVSVYIVFDARVKYASAGDKGADYPVGVKIRADGLTDDAKDPEKFSTEYEGGAFRNDSGNVSITLTSSENISDEWTRLEFCQTFTADDINSKLWSKWMLCFDRMENFESASALEFKNTGVYLEDEYESPNKPKETPTPKPTATPTAKAGDEKTTPAPSGNKSSADFKPLVLNVPINFDRYPITFAETKAPANATEAVSSSPEAGATATASAEQDEKDSGNTGLIIGIIAAAAVIVAGAVCAVIVINKKKK